MSEVDLREAIRLGSLLVDEETGEILSEHDVGVDELTLQLKDAIEQRKGWEQTEALLKKAIGKKLDATNVGIAETPYGVVRWQNQLRRSAKADRFCEMAEEFGLPREQRDKIIVGAATVLDPKALDGEVTALLMLGQGESAEGLQLRRAIDATIDEKMVSFVLWQPLRKPAPKLERETVDTGEISR